MPEPLMTPCVLFAVALSIVANPCQRADEYRAAKESAEAISGFVAFYYDHEIHFDGSTFPALAKKPLRFPNCVYGLIPPEFLHDIVAAEVVLPDDTVRELLPLSRLTNLKALSVKWARYSDVELGQFEQFRKLEYLDLSHSFNLTDEGLPRLAALKTLKVLKISGDGISEYGIEMLRRKMPNCAINGRMACRYVIALRTKEQVHPPEPAAAPAVNGKSSAPAR